MPSATFRKLCLDAVDPQLVGRFWAAVLHLTWVPAETTNEGGVYGSGARPVLWINEAARPKSVKHRVHLDVYTATLAELEAFGSVLVRPEGDGRRWTVMADPEAGEYCAFRHDDPPANRLHGLVVDGRDPAAQARFWVDVLGGRVVDDPSGYSSADDVPGLDFTVDFVPVPEPKSAPNRIHWDLTAPDIAPLLDRGARVVRVPDEEVRWHVLADPEGNEFCVFP